MKRYTPEIVSPIDVEMKHDPEGLYVRYSDIEPLIEALRGYANAITDQTVFVNIPYDEMDPDDFDIVEEFEIGEPGNFGERAQEALQKAGM